VEVGRRHRTQGRQLCRRLARDGGGGTAEVFGADVTYERQAAELVAAITGRFGLVDVLVLNATGPRQPDVNRLWGTPRV
jgi:NAD(P)-dependent dehydrogenase (short-subunit alcohol dehydrogenase family)